MTGFEPRMSGVGSDPSTNCATTTAIVQLCWSIRMTSASASHHLKQFHLESIKVVPVPGTNVV